MPRESKKSKRSVSRLLTIVGPILIIAFAGLVIYTELYSGYSNSRLTTHAYLQIGVAEGYSGGGLSIRYIVPDKSIGIPGGYMSTQRYLGDGVNGNYPLYTRPDLCGNITGTGAMCLINIVSTVQRDYTLQDFFDVWGVPLGPSLTLSPTFTSNSTYSWAMCITPVGGTRFIATDDWGTHVLTRTEVILLAYSTVGCG
jgi:hypothetical protein